jgi:phage shock protein PspC (stress-responsive transcriptional regulator)
MNKTLSVNIGGMVFHVEESAFKELNSYLEAIKGYFTTSEGRDEIIQDIEARIAEMFHERLGDKRQVVTGEDVSHVISTLGRPEQYLLDEQMEQGEESQDQSDSQESKRSYRRLYRDPDDRIIGGVCAGVSHYVGLDPIWLRLLFAISFFVFGSGLLLYILLIIIIPKAKTPSEKLEMKGERVSLSNLKKNFQDEASSISKNAESGISRFFDALGQILLGAVKLLGKLIAGAFLIMGIILLGSFALTFLALLGVGGIAVPFFITDLFMTPWQQTLAIISLFLTLGIPVLVVLSKAIQVLFKVNYSNKVVNWLALALWIIGLGLAVLVGGSIAGEFKTEQSQRIEIPVAQPEGDTLYLDLLNATNFRDESYYINNKSMDDVWNWNVNSDSLRIDDVQLDIIRSTSGQFELVQIASSRGKDRKGAIENARAIEYKLVQDGNTLRFDESFILPSGQMFRGQELQLLLKVPEGKTVFMSEEMDEIIYDIENVTNTYDGDMVGRGWTMTPQGLECIGCTLPGYNARFHKSKDNFKISIDNHGVKVKSIKDEILEDLEDDEEVDINISDEGIHIEAK